jgi:uncharacterized protein with beta-barrel porin domain
LERNFGDAVARLETGRNDRPVRLSLLTGASGVALRVASLALVLGVALPPRAHADTAVTINPVQNSTYTLMQGSNPITFGSGTDIVDSAAGPFGKAIAGGYGNWTITNLGVIQENGSLGTGIQLLSQSTVTNGGTIAALSVNEGIGIAMGQGGLVTNQAGGTIAGSFNGVYIGGFTGSVVNSGVITATDWLSYGVKLFSGGVLTNNLGGTISGDVAGVTASDQGRFGTITGATSTITNAGTIRATDGGGVKLLAGGGVTNQGSGLIVGTYWGVYAKTAAGTVTNAGTILSTGVEYSGGGGVGLTLTNGGTLQIGGTLPTGGSIANGGTILGADSSISLVGSGVTLTAGGEVTNQSGGTISGVSTGVFIRGGPASVTNAGWITATAPFGSGVFAALGTVINQAGGTISGTTGVIGSAVSNAGTIMGTSEGVGIDLPGGQVSNLAGGTITGGQGIFVGLGAGAVTNAGVVSGSRYAGVHFEGTGSLSNAAGGLITGLYSGVFARGSGSTVTNAGVISATGPGLTFAGAAVQIANDSLPGVGVEIVGGGTVTNSGTISGATASVEFGGVGTNVLTLQSGSTLVGDAFGSALEGATNALVLQGAGIANNSFGAFNTLDVTASGVWALNGVSAIGATTIDSGNLQVGDAAHAGAQLISAVAINPGGTLSGHGTLVGDVSNNGGTVSPGGSIGTLTINGNLTQSSTSTLAVEVTPTSNSSLVVTGAASLDGALVLNADAGSYRKGTTYTVLTAGSVTGSFSSLSATGGLQISEANTSDTGVVTLLNGVFHSLGATPNQTSVGDALVSVPVGATDFDTVANAAVGLTPGAQQNAALDQLGGEIDADFVTIGRDNARAFLGGIGDQLSAAGEAHAGGDDRDPWVRAYGSLGNLDGDTNAHGLLSTSGGAMAGASRGWRGGTVGAALSYGHTDLNLRGLNQKGQFDTGALALYGEHRMGVFFFDAAGSIAYDHGDTTRTILFPGIARRPTGGFNGYTGALTTAAGTRLQGQDNLLFEPSVSLTYSHVSQSSFDEKGGGGADLLIGSKDQDALESLVQGKISKPFTLSNGNTLRADFKLGWDHEWTPTGTNITEAFAAAGGIPFNVAGATPDHDRGIVGAGVAYDASKRMTWYGRYEMTLGQHQDDNALTAGFRFVW